MNREQKAATVEEIAAQLQEAEAVFAVDYRGISVPQAAELRTRLRDADATFRVVKNSLTELAADRAGAETLKALLDGPTALTFVRGDAATAAKALSDFGRAADILAFKGGLLGGEELDADQIRAIARLPARDVLFGQLVGLVASPVGGLVRTLNALIQGLALQLGQIAEQGLVTGTAPAPDEAPAADPGEEPSPNGGQPEAQQAEAEAEAPEPAAEADPAPEAQEPAAEAQEPEPDQDSEPPEPVIQPDPAEGSDDPDETGQPEGNDPAAEAQPTSEDDNQADASTEADTPAEAKEDA
jgi:large subunit ribosomal protein L10